MKAGLVECPWCGTVPDKDNIELVWGEDIRTQQDTFAVSCPNSDCECHGPMRLSSAGALEAWNRRYACT